MTILHLLRTLLPVTVGILLVVSLISAAATAAFVFKAETAQGKITSLRQQADENGKLLFQPTFEFTVNDQDYVVTPSSYVSPSPGNIGDEVPVLYDPSNPSNARIDRFVYTWMLPTITLVLAIVFGVIYTALAWVGRNWRAEPSPHTPS